MFSSSLPPVGHLPHWPRVGGLDKSSARPPTAERPRAPAKPGARDSREHEERERAELRISLLHRDIRFLQEQHRETLGGLHAELELLRRRNKELQYKLIMEMPQLRETVSPPGSTLTGEAPQQDTEQDPQTAEDRPDHTTPQQSSLSRTQSEGDPPAPEVAARRGLITSLRPLRIHESPLQPPRTPTLQECEVIIQQLYHANSLQSQEVPYPSPHPAGVCVCGGGSSSSWTLLSLFQILRMRAVLQDILVTKKISPDTYVLSRAFLADRARTKEPERFPELPRRTVPKSLPEVQPGAGGRVSLPPLKQSLGSSAADRQKKVQALQRGRLRRTVH
ncbi:coiled-coil domain-containing protein 74B-like [Arapaima gigas]